MSDQAIIVPVPSGGDTLLDHAVDTYLAGLSDNTQRAYESRIRAFLDWRSAQPPAPLVTHMKQYVAYLQHERDMAPRSVQAHVNTIKGLIKTAAALDPSLASGLAQLELVKAPRVRGEVQGKRLSAAQAKQLVNAPGKDSLKGLRDTAILALMLVLGLRRSEVCSLTWGHVSELEGHRVIANLKGKHGRVRTLKLPVWLWRVLHDWGEAAELDMDDPEQVIFLPVTKDERVLAYRNGITPDAIYKLLNEYTEQASLPTVKPHDLRRTAALLARRGGASIEQVQLMLGHASPQTTSNYIGESLDLDDNAVDYNPLRV